MLSIPLASFPAGDYRLEIKVTDKASSKTLVQNVAFTVIRLITRRPATGGGPCGDARGHGR